MSHSVCLSIYIYVFNSVYVAYRFFLSNQPYVCLLSICLSVSPYNNLSVCLSCCCMFLFFLLCISLFATLPCRTVYLVSPNLSVRHTNALTFGWPVQHSFILSVCFKISIKKQKIGRSIYIFSFQHHWNLECDRKAIF